MKKAAAIALITIALMAYSRPGHAHFRGGISIGPGFLPLLLPCGPAPVPREPAAVEEENATVEYLQPEARQSWYYCSNPEGYYRYVKECQKGWTKVEPTAPPESEE